MRRLIVLVILQSAIAPASAQDLDPIRDFDIRTIEELGREIFRLDRYAAIATDILLSQDLDLDDLPLRGWIVTDTATGPLVTFVGAYEDSLRAIFDVRPDSNGDARFKVVEGRNLTTEEQARFLARQTASEVLTEPCSSRYNAVVLPDPTTQGWLVYLLAATTEPNLVLAGGHYRLTISEDGLSVLDEDRLSVSCLVLDKSSADIPDGGEPVMMVMTHVVSRTPVETHVYLSLLHDMGFAIVTGEDEFWIAQGGSVQKIEP